MTPALATQQTTRRELSASPASPLLLGRGCVHTMAIVPVELLHEIVDHLRSPELAVFRLASQTCRAIADPLFFAVLFIPSNRLHLRKHLGFIRDVAAGNTGWSAHATALVVVSAVGRLDDRNAPRAEESEVETVPGLLVDAIRSCPRLCSFRLSAFQCPAWLFESVANCTTAFPNVKYFDIEHEKHTPLLPSVSRLTTLKISTLGRLRRGLVHKKSQGIQWPPSMAQPLLPQVLEIVRHSPQLRVLQLLGGDSWDDIWKLLTRLRIPLVSLTIDLVTPPLLAYLRSFSGLAVLEIQRRDKHGTVAADTADALAQEFFEQVLPMHRASLRIFRCEAERWPFGNHVVDALVQMEHLTDFAMCVNVKDAPSIISLALETLPRLPRLERIALCAEVGAPFMELVQATLARFPDLVLVEDTDYIEGRADWDWLDVALEARWDGVNRESHYPVWLELQGKVVWAVRVLP